MIQSCVVWNCIERHGSTTLLVVGPKHDFVDTSGNGGSSAHGTGLQRCIERGAVEMRSLQRRRRFAQRYYFCMCGRVIETSRCISSTTDDNTVLYHNGANRHLPFAIRHARLLKRMYHPSDIFLMPVRHSHREKQVFVVQITAGEHSMRYGRANWGLWLLTVGLMLTGCTSSKDASDKMDAGGNEGASDEDSRRKIMVSSFDATTTPSPISGTEYDEHLVKSDPLFTVTSFKDSSLGIYMTLAGGGFDIRSMTVRIVGKDGREIASGTTVEITSSGTMNIETKQASITTYASVQLSGPIVLSQETALWVEMISGSGGARWELTKTDQATNGTVSTNGRLKLFLDVGSVDDGTRFALRVERLKPAAENEYLPSAEEVRFQVRDPAGRTIWDSSDGMMFAQVIGTVRPAAVGATVTHETVWNGLKSTTRKPAAAGTYTVVASIPSRPLPYFIQKEFSYSGR